MMGVGIRGVGVARARGFNPSSLFAGGTVAGAWYDPSDLSTLFTTSAGTTQCAMPGQGSAVSVGRMLDKSQGLALGSETVTNGDFSGGTTTGWSNQSATLSVVSGQLSVVPSTTFGYAYQTLTTVVGTTYRLTFSFDQSTAAIARYFVGTSLGGAEIVALTTVSGVGSVSRYFTATTTTTFIHFGAQNSSGLQALFDNISVKALPGNHAIAFNDTTARPELRARVNLLTYSEEFNNAAWTKSGLNTTGTPAWVNVATAPDGNTTADKVIENSSNVAHYIQKLWDNQTIAYSWSIYLKSAERTFGFVSFRTANVGRPTYVVVVDLTTGVATDVVNNTGVASNTYSVSAAGNGWWRITLNVTNNSAYFGETYFEWGPSNSGTPIYSGGLPAYLGDGTSGILTWGADLRPANIGANVPAYQRIADANTYDTSGFPLYLRFDGIDDSMYTPANLNLSGTDKVAVFAGVRKLSDAAGGQVLETSSDLNANNGTFLMAFPGNIGVIGPNMVLGLRGTASAFSDARTYTAPITGVLQASFDIAQATVADEIKQRINGAVPTSISYLNANAGTGNFGTYPLYIGSRNNASTWFNGHLHSLIIAGSAVSASNISATEQWVAGKTGIVIP